MTPLRRSPRTTASMASTNKKREKVSSNLVTPTPKKKARKATPRKVASLAVAAVASSQGAAAVTSSSSTKLLPTSRSKPLALRFSSHRTESFDALWDGSISELATATAPHTLILGTHPSVTSLAEQQYYGHSVNAFWWIAGDCLGFRRAPGLTVSGEPFKFSSELRYGHDKIIPYTQQVQTLTSHGFAIWDVVKSCQRQGSLDANIRREEANDIRGFCKQHDASMKRIVLANGGTGCTMFNKHFREWWESGELVPASDEFSNKAFAKVYQRSQASVVDKEETSDEKEDGVSSPLITCISAISVSPAAAMYSYKEKRDFWEQHVYQPGLRDYKETLDEGEQQAN